MYVWVCNRQTLCVYWIFSCRKKQYLWKNSGNKWLFSGRICVQAVSSTNFCVKIMTCDGDDECDTWHIFIKNRRTYPLWIFAPCPYNACNIIHRLCFIVITTETFKALSTLLHSGRHLDAMHLQQRHNF